MFLLKYKMKSVLSGSASTKAIIMTHDISFFMDFSKALDEISEYCKSVGKKASHQLFTLSDKLIKKFKNKNQNEYTDLLKEIFEFANADKATEENSIGNQMRRVLEAFSTFSFKCSSSFSKPSFINLMSSGFVSSQLYNVFNDTSILFDNSFLFIYILSLVIITKKL